MDRTHDLQWVWLGSCPVVTPMSSALSPRRVRYGDTRRLLYGISSLLLACFLPARTPVLAQGGPVQYGYDELGRLTIVVDGAGNAAVYHYDAVGNLLSIQRITAAEVPEPVAIYALSPPRGRAGSTVSILGKGLGATAGQSTVTFTGGAAATVTGASPTALRVTVPGSALNGPISVAAPAGSAVSPMPFKVIGPLTVAPAGPLVAAGTVRPFSAAGAGGATPSVHWAVNDMPGGNASVGTISAAGVYSAPASVADAFLATITATDQADVSTKGSTTAVIVPVGSQRLAAAARGVSLRLAQSAIPNSLQTSVAIRVGGVAAALAASRAISFNLGPVITGVAPASGVRGAAGLTVTLAGVGFNDATQVTFLRNNVPDAAVSAALVSVGPQGTQATLSVSIASNAVVDPRVVRITTPGGASTVVGTGANVFTVQ